ncbi:hypothetical protein Aperf_G00000108216 [Anoplocephala perfoliata]
MGGFFLGLGIVGVLLRTDADFLVRFVNTFTEKFLSGATKEQATDIANFMLTNGIQTSPFFIVIGFLLACISLVGFVSTCCSFNKLLQIHAVILTCAVLLEAITVGIVFGVPGFYTTIVDRGLKHSLERYNPNSPEGKTPADLWNIVMEAENQICCGMDGAGDFKSTPYNPKCPKYCCKSDNSCSISDALILNPPIRGCREKVEKYSNIYTRKVLSILICAIVVQAILAILTYACLTCKSASPI